MHAMQLEAEPILDAPSRFGETAFRPKRFQMAPVASMLTSRSIIGRNLDTTNTFDVPSLPARC